MELILLTILFYCNIFEKLPIPEIVDAGHVHMIVFVKIFMMIFIVTSILIYATIFLYDQSLTQT